MSTVHMGVAASQMERRGLSTEKALSTAKWPHRTVF
ncbi:MAG: hypothetical protein PHR21_03240 [Oscillospiraceae bacterium]|nr:hypothetical protein [Oscillospiraceae bacterium]